MHDQDKELDGASCYTATLTPIEKPDLYFKRTGSVPSKRLIPEPPEEKWINLEEMFKSGNVIEIHGTYWEIKRAEIKAGDPGGLNLKLKSKIPIRRKLT